jgi:hypothetical protein
MEWMCVVVASHKGSHVGIILGGEGGCGPGDGIVWLEGGEDVVERVGAGVGAVWPV